MALLMALLGACSSNPESSTSSTTRGSGSVNTAGEGRWDGKITALSYNVAGLPEVLSGSNPEKNTALIGPKLNAFDLVLLQETWKTPKVNPLAPTRVYFEILESLSTHRYSAPMADLPFGSDPDRPEALIADGLGLFSNFPLGETTRVRWTECFGGADTSDRGAADCLSLKGLSVTPVTVAKGVRIDVYNLHGEAGSSDTDQKLQGDDYRQLATFIAQHSKGRAVILGGDTNLHIEADPEHAQDVEDAKIWSAFLKATGLTDACDPANCHDTPRIDKFAYRNGDGITLGVVSRNVLTKQFSDTAGKPLSDHDPLAVTFGWQRQS